MDCHFDVTVRFLIASSSKIVENLQYISIKNKFMGNENMKQNCKGYYRIPSRH